MSVALVVLVCIVVLLVVLALIVLAVAQAIAAREDRAAMLAVVASMDEDRKVLLRAVIAKNATEYARTTSVEQAPDMLEAQLRATFGQMDRPNGGYDLDPDTGEMMSPVGLGER